MHNLWYNLCFSSWTQTRAVRECRLPALRATDLTAAGEPPLHEAASEPALACEEAAPRTVSTAVYIRTRRGKCKDVDMMEIQIQFEMPYEQQKLVKTSNSYTSFSLWHFKLNWSSHWKHNLNFTWQNIYQPLLNFKLNFFFLIFLNTIHSFALFCFRSRCTTGSLITVIYSWWITRKSDRTIW